MGKADPSIASLNNMSQFPNLSRVGTNSFRKDFEGKGRDKYEVRGNKSAKDCPATEPYLEAHLEPEGVNGGERLVSAL